MKVRKKTGQRCLSVPRIQNNSDGASQHFSNHQCTSISFDKYCSCVDNGLIINKHDWHNSQKVIEPTVKTADCFFIIRALFIDCLCVVVAFATVETKTSTMGHVSIVLDKRLISSMSGANYQ